VNELRGTSYYITLMHAMKRYSAEQSLFPLEVALDLDYWRKLWDGVNSLPQRDHDNAMQIVGLLVDMNNFMWAIRYREHHHLTEEEIINYTLPFGRVVKDNDIRAIAAGANIAQVVMECFPELGQIDSALQQPNGALSKLDIQLQRLVVNQCRAAFIGYPFHIGVPLAYLILNRMEIQDLTVLIEAKSRRMPVERFRPYLVMGYPSEGQ
jgi:V/A-type H+-transporting ATPase subunit C